MSYFIRRIVSRVVLCSFIAAALMVGGAVAVHGQGRGIALSSPGPNTTVAPGTQVNLKALIKTLYPKIVRVDFRANGVLIGSGTGNNWSAVWTPSTGGNYNITAEAITIGNTIALTSKPTQLAVLTVLYDQLGGPGNWGWFNSQNILYSYYEELGESDIYAVTTHLNVALASAFTIRTIEFAPEYFNDSTGELLPLTDGTLDSCKVKIWNTANGNFQTNASLGSLSNTSPGSFTAGSRTVPVGTQPWGSPVYVVGWNNLNIPIAAGNIQISVQCPVNTNAQHIFSTYRSIFANSDTALGATKTPGGSQQNFVYSNTSLAIKITGFAN